MRVSEWPPAKWACHTSPDSQPGSDHAHLFRVLPASLPIFQPTFKYDALYIKKQSFWLDLKLIALSFWITFRGTWEYRGKKF